MKKIGLLIFLSVVFLFFSCLPYYQKMKPHSVLKIPIGTNSNSVFAKRTSDHELKLPVFYYVEQNEFFINDYYNKSLKVFPINGSLKKRMTPKSFKSFWNPYFFVVDKDGGYYVENQSATNYSGDASYFSDILKFDKEGYLVKQICTVPGALKKMSINKYNYLTLVYQDVTNLWLVQRYINDKLISDNVFFTNNISDIFFLKDDNELVFKVDSTNESVFYSYNVINNTLDVLYRDTPSQGKVILRIDSQQNIFFAKYYNEKYLLIETSSMGSREITKKLSSIQSKDKFGLFVDLFVSPNGAVYQLRLDDSYLNLVEYNF